MVLFCFLQKLKNRKKNIFFFSVFFLSYQMKCPCKKIDFKVLSDNTQAFEESYITQVSCSFQTLYGSLGLGKSIMK